MPSLASSYRRKRLSIFARTPEPARRRGMNSPAESRKSPLKGTPTTCLQSASADFDRLSRGIH
ncbi:MAG: hypothetical protein LUQ59_11960, partial [Methanothrix sp.]|nr:hypothetical protein [Methanothrix sp.]